MYWLANSCHAGIVTARGEKTYNLLPPVLPNLNCHISPALFEQTIFVFTKQFAATFFITQLVFSPITRNGQRQREGF
jgi:hypothetical protein